MRVLRVAYRIAQRAMPPYRHRCSPKKFTQHQLFACLVLKQFFALDYRGVETLLAEDESLRAAIELRVAPDFTTLHKAAERLLEVPACNRLLDETIRVAKRTPLLQSPVRVAAIDSSGFEAHRASNYFVRRRAPHGKQTGKWQSVYYSHFPKLAMICDCSSHLILAAVSERGPCLDDGHWSRAMTEARRRVRIALLLADAGYDAEWIHHAARLVFGVRTIIPPKRGRPTRKPPGQFYRRKMWKLFQRSRTRKPYRQRSQAETVFSMLKRRLDSSVNAHSYPSQSRTLLLKAITHNIMILRRK
jgi:hypothetical protein